jgi:hypothetical protein
MKELACIFYNKAAQHATALGGGELARSFVGASAGSSAAYADDRPTPE